MGANLLVYRPTKPCQALPSLLVHVGGWSGDVELILELSVSTPRERHLRLAVVSLAYHVYLWRRLLLPATAVASYGSPFTDSPASGPWRWGLGTWRTWPSIYLVALLLLPLSFRFVIPVNDTSIDSLRTSPLTPSDTFTGADFLR